MHRLVICVARIGQIALWAMLLGFLVLVALPRVTRLDVLVVRGGSMEPAIPLGSVVIVDRGDRTPSVGSIASFRDPEAGMVTHRVVAIDGARLVTKGDANATEDAIRREAADVYGTVVLSIPMAGFVIHVLQVPVVFLLVLLGTGGFLVANSVRAIVDEVARIRRQRGLFDAD
jgi:signal peptidase I